MAWFVPHLFRTRQSEAAATRVPGTPAVPADFDRLLDALRALYIAVPCAGCGRAHEMTAAELVARQLIQGAAGTSEECDGGAALRAVLPVEEVVACGGDVARLRARLEARGLRCSAAGETPPLMGRREGHRLLLAH
jgi:hypothetical protein